MTAPRRVYAANGQITYEIAVHFATTEPERFIARLEANLKKDGDCVIWQGGSKTDAGYARTTFIYDNRRWIVAVHRLFLTMMLKHPIPPGWHAGHLHEICKSPACVKHLYLEDRCENSKEASNRRWKAVRERRERERA